MSKKFMNKELLDLKSRIIEALARSGRDPSSLKIVAVSKGQSLERIKKFLEQKFDFWALGESYLDELQEKQKQLPQISLEQWHFIGRLQSRKLSTLLERVDVLHSVSRSKELELIAQNPKQFFVQVNVSLEKTKLGVSPEALKLFLEEVKALNLSRYCLGLMAMPSPLRSVGESQVRREFSELRKLRDQLLPKGLLNVGTSDDFEIAIQEGSQVIRLGSVLFGLRLSANEA
jgi:PLP dependent protein